VHVQSIRPHARVQFDWAWCLNKIRQT
jgi:hypothetical protein